MTDENDDLPLPPESGGGFFGDAPAEEIATTPVAEATPYRVLARKYRPQTFDDLIGQDSLVRILRRAFELERVAHAFMLTGVRGVGKTTTARIIARALNCIGPDGTGGPTADPCGVCANCTAILADRHPDVLEMDAASRTGVDDVREIIEATRFRPMQARMKVFIIDEVHMLSRNAFNALLKTLEEPPPQVTFIFATTELRKVPVTVLSRCQRFDLRRVPQSLLAGHFHNIALKEGATLSEDALALIARAADGSVRDGLSLLDQAIAQGASDANAVADMLGLADRGLVFDLLDALMAGRVADALDLTDQAYARGADLGVLLVDLLDLLHLISRLKAIPSLRESRDLPEAERTRGMALADRLSNTVLGRAWQILLKGVQEVETAPDRRQAAEMLLIRLCHASLLPTPDRLIRELTEGGQDLSLPVSRSTGSPSAGEGFSPTTRSSADGLSSAGLAGASVSETSGGPSPRAHVRLVANGGEIIEPGIGYAEPLPEPEPQPEPAPRTWREMVAMVAREREPVLHGLLRNAVHLVRFSPPDVQIRAEEPQARIERQLQKLLDRVYPGQWRVSASTAAGEPTLDEQGAEVVAINQASVEQHPLVQAILRTFPGAKIGEVQDHSLDEYGLPPEITVPLTDDEPPDLEFAPLDADFLDEDDLN
ncbi:DNA polymerase III subunit gamma/tau [Gluconobacter kanchanaburiensis]|uniref:DNA polymerase III subunit gamma/tau n=1 Tax=Gluconobacter kanchanaburiensis NBRC 103587 TaxID=1307948 RepID=A0A511B6M2_9PROT|nr:DNA polymerase III subunit gamma/tau [Gluconobacter kanchanaburiensis]MBF0861645.1 DNA polymerase III subunit gamma/tau [Gluconobacter kanchanaburiensis]GBR67151.1 DNA polymerase III subunits gamma and tau [Gluconobacter kanchanaburiensis NBRC 103587]GEK95291.1 DNA polymerase III subunit gamma/tau [Gluconobacter kanchanaburiensis NBRC 103587]